jgi:hypothetical protein
MSDEKKGPLDAVVDGAVAVMKTLAPKVPASAAPVVLMVVLGVVVVGVVAAFATTAVLVAVVVLVLAGIAAAVLVGRRAGDDAPAPGNTIGFSDALDGPQRDAVCQIVQNAVADVADALHVEPKTLRGNVFGCDGKGRLRIMPEYSHQMENVAERSITMPIGQGSNGRAWQTGRPNIAIRAGDWDDANALPLDQAARVDKDVTWIISAPVFAPAQAPPPTWVLNVDALRDSRSKEDLSLAVGKVMLWADAMGRVIDQGGTP